MAQTGASILAVLLACPFLQWRASFHLLWGGCEHGFVCAFDEGFWWPCGAATRHQSSLLSVPSVTSRNRYVANFHCSVSTCCWSMPITGELTARSIAARKAFQNQRPHFAGLHPTGIQRGDARRWQESRYCPRFFRHYQRWLRARKACTPSGHI